MPVDDNHNNVIIIWLRDLLTAVEIFSSNC